MAKLIYDTIEQKLFLEESERDYNISDNYYRRHVDFNVHKGKTHTSSTNTYDDVFNCIGTKPNKRIRKTILAENINPYLIYVNNNLFVYFGNDVPRLMTNTVKLCTSHYKKFTFNDHLNEQNEEYVYIKVKSPEKLFGFYKKGTSYNVREYEILYRLDTSSTNNYVFKLDLATETYKKLKKIKEDEVDNTYLDMYSMNWMYKTESYNKMKRGYCECCGSPNFEFYVDKNCDTSAGVVNYRRLCSDCYKHFVKNIF